MNRILHFLLPAAAALPLLFSCNRGPAPEVPDPEAGLPPFPKPSEQIDKIPLTRSEEGFVQAGNEFAWRLTRIVWEQNQDKGSIFISPLSVQFALGMLGNGADEAVASQLAAVLGYEGTDAINAYCAKMIGCLPMVDTTVTLALADGVLIDEIYTPDAAFKAAVEEYYDAIVESMPFTQPDAVKKRVNDWCNRHTYGRIPEVLEEVDPNSFMYLMNAIYFNARWSSPFEASDSKTESFHTLSGKTTQVRMMHKTFDQFYAYCESDLYQSVSLGYGNGHYALRVYLPKKGVELSRLLAEDLTRTMAPSPCKLILSLPSFRTDYDIEMRRLLADMGLPIAPYNRLVEKQTGVGEISKVIHKANITVNESGTEAAAVTVIEMRYGSAGPSQGEPPTIIFTADHPFLYTITENTTGAILFTGVYTGN